MKALARALIVWMVFFPVYQLTTATAAWVDLLNILLPTASWAGPLEAAANAGASFGRGQIHGPASDGTNIYYDSAAGTASTPVSTYFPSHGAVDDRAQTVSNFGNNTQQVLLNQNTAARLETEDSQHAQAYRTAMSGFRASSQPNLVNDPIWTRSREILDGVDPVYAAFFSGCTETAQLYGSSNTMHVPDYRKCERFNDLSTTCDWFHDYTSIDLHDILAVRGISFLESCGVGCVNIIADVPFSGHSGGILQTHDFGLSILEPSVINSITWTHTPYFSDIEMGCPGWDCRIKWVYHRYEMDGPGNAWDYSVESYGGIHRPSWNGLDVTVDLINGGDFTVRNVYSFETDGGHYYSAVAGFYSVFQVRYDTIKDLGWTPGPGCAEALSRINHGVCDLIAANCLDQPAVDGSGCLLLGGTAHCVPSMAPAPIPGINKFCRQARITSDCTVFYKGEMDCFTDVNGIEHCPVNDGSNDNPCAVYETDPNCSFVGTACIEGGRDNLNVCMAYEETYDCGGSQTLAGTSEALVTECHGPISCMGESCVTQPRETNPDFGKAAASLQGLQFIAMEMGDCNHAACVVLKGQAMECKKAFFGWVDCCDRPSGVSLVDYFNLAMSSWWVAQRSGAVDWLAGQGLDIPGAWKTLTQPVTATWDAVKKPFVSAFETLSQAGTGSSAQTIIFDVASIKGAVTDAVGQFVGSAFGPDVQALIFKDQAGQWVLNSTVSMAMSVIMWAYTIYSIVKILVNLIWSCTRSEFEFGAKRELKVCHELGSYCKSKTIFGCTEKREAACCFNSPFARIVHQHGRSQLGMGWGTAKNPQCGGMTVDQLASLNWDTPQMQAGLQEWLGILVAGGMLPSTMAAQEVQYSLENATTSAFGAPGQPHARERAQQRTQDPAMDFEGTYETIRNDMLP